MAQPATPPTTVAQGALCPISLRVGMELALLVNHMQHRGTLLSSPLERDNREDAFLPRTFSASSRLSFQLEETEEYRNEEERIRDPAARHFPSQRTPPSTPTGFFEAGLPENLSGGVSGVVSHNQSSSFLPTVEWQRLLRAYGIIGPTAPRLVELLLSQVSLSFCLCALKLIVSRHMTN